MKSDALDDHGSRQILGRPISDDLLWSAFVAMFNRIGKDCGVDFLCWAAKGEHLGEAQHDWGVISDEMRDAAQALIKRLVETRGAA